MVIYKTTNLINNKIYVGQDINSNPLYLGSGKIIKRAIKKFGIDNFKKEILEYCKNQEELDLKEIYWIKTLNSTNKDIGYNICEGGRSYRTMKGENHPNFGKRLSTEERKRISELTKLGMTEKVKEHIRKMRKLQVFSEETRKKWSENRRGKGGSLYGRKGKDHPAFGIPCSEEKRKKIGEANGGEKNGMALKYFIRSPIGEVLEFITRQKVINFLNCNNYFFKCKKFKGYILLKIEKFYSKVI